MLPPESFFLPPPSCSSILFGVMTIFSQYMVTRYRSLQETRCTEQVGVITNGVRTSSHSAMMCKMTLYANRLGISILHSGALQLDPNPSGPMSAEQVGFRRGECIECEQHRFSDASAGRGQSHSVKATVKLAAWLSSKLGSRAGPLAGLSLAEPQTNSKNSDCHC